MDGWRGWEHFFRNVDQGFTWIIATAIYVFILVVPTILHASIMIKNLEGRLSGRVPWSKEPGHVIMHAVATLLFMVLTLMPLIVLLLL